MKIRDNTIYLRHILDAILKIEQYSQRISRDDFNDNTLLQDGIIRQIEIIGEASKRISFDNYKEIPWKDVSGMRDKLIHDYFGIDIDAVWETIENDIPVFKKAIERILSNLT